jgi:hypothetical protein
MITDQGGSWISAANYPMKGGRAREAVNFSRPLFEPLDFQAKVVFGRVEAQNLGAGGDDPHTQDLVAGKKDPAKIGGSYA